MAQRIIMSIKINQQKYQNKLKLCRNVNKRVKQYISEAITIKEELSTEVQDELTLMDIISLITSEYDCINK